MIAGENTRLTMVGQFELLWTGMRTGDKKEKAVTLKNTQKLAKFLSYVLGHRPDEFGLVPENRGYIKIKELLKAINKEEGWRHIRMAHLNEVVLTVVPSPIEINDKRIRARDRSKSPQITLAEQLPKLLYIAVRNRAYPAIIERGLHAGDQGYLVLSSDADMAQRMGQRRDQHPVMLTVQVARSTEMGTQYQKYGENLYLTDLLLPNTFSGPPLPKEKSAPVPPKKTTKPVIAKTPGSYFPDLLPPNEPKRPRRKEVEWKKDRRRARRHKYKEQG
jgi:putative RNA 2'-phosphotransferase